MRHFFLLMGIFSLFNGFIYNDFTSMGTQTFGKSCWAVDENMKDPIRSKNRLCKRDPDCVYPFGIDPMWFRASELEVQYLNSFKMKISVIFGVGHMLLGTFIRCVNFVKDGRWIEFFAVALTQLAMMVSLFGFMNYLIVVKWLTDWTPTMDSGLAAPSVIPAMVGMFL